MATLAKSQDGNIRAHTRSQLSQGDSSIHSIADLIRAFEEDIVERGHDEQTDSELTYSVNPGLETFDTLLSSHSSELRVKTLWIM